MPSQSQCSSSDADTDVLMQIAAHRMSVANCNDIFVIRNDGDAHTADRFDIDNHLRGTAAVSGVVEFFSDLLDTTLGSKNDGDAFHHDQAYTLGQGDIIFATNDDIFVYAPDNLRTISVTAKDDAFIYAPSNHGSITASAKDVFVFAPDNSGSVSAFANSAANSYAEAKDSCGTIAVAKAMAVSEAYNFVYAPDNYGTISAHANAVSTASANSTVQIADEGAMALAIAITIADARAKVLVYAPGDSGSVDAGANAVAEVTTSAQTNSELGFAIALSDVTTTAETFVIQQGSYGHQWFA